jgi:hypothetical protein
VTMILLWVGLALLGFVGHALGPSAALILMIAGLILLTLIIRAGRR